MSIPESGEQNPFQRILQTAGKSGKKEAEKNALRMYLGTVLTVEPLTVDVASTVQTQDVLYCNPQLLKDYCRTAETKNPTGTISASVGACTQGCNIATLTEQGGGVIATEELKLTNYGFEVGDLLVLLSPNDQYFVILCKAVHL